MIHTNVATAVNSIHFVESFVLTLIGALPQAGLLPVEINSHNVAAIVVLVVERFEIFE